MKSKKKIPKTFFGFLIASVLIWLLITLSKEYVITINFPISYQKIPQDKLVQSTPQKTLEIAVKSSGFRILKTRLSSKEITINANNLTRKSGSNYYLLTRNQKNNIQKQIPKGIELQQILKDTLFLDLGSLVTKKLPVKTNLKIKYHIGYDLSEEIKISPDSIFVYGPDSYVNNLETIELLPLQLDDVKENFTTQVQIKVPKNIKNLKFSIKEITISGNVEKFTEGSLEIPYRIVNKPKDVTINTLAKEVTVVYIIGLSHFNKITEDSFQIECDYSVSEKNNLNYLIPKLVNKSEFIKSYKIIPNKIDFLIQN